MCRLIVICLVSSNSKRGIMHNLFRDLENCWRFVTYLEISGKFRTNWFVDSSGNSFRKHVAVTLIISFAWRRLILTLDWSKFIIRNNKVFIPTQWIGSIWFRILLLRYKFLSRSYRFCLLKKCLMTSKFARKTALTLCSSDNFYFLLSRYFFIIV